MVPEGPSVDMASDAVGATVAAATGTVVEAGTDVSAAGWSFASSAEVPQARTAISNTAKHSRQFDSRLLSKLVHCR